MAFSWLKTKELGGNNMQIIELETCVGPKHFGYFDKAEILIILINRHEMQK